MQHNVAIKSLPQANEILQEMNVAGCPDDANDRLKEGPGLPTEFTARIGGEDKFLLWGGDRRF
jgi:hypothetical protein